jgi:hypothetical protein
MRNERPEEYDVDANECPACEGMGGWDDETGWHDCSLCDGMGVEPAVEEEDD